MARYLNKATPEDWDAVRGIRGDEYNGPILSNPAPQKGSKRQEGGSHYQLPIQPVDYITKNKLGYMEGNVIKYVTRHKSKNGAEDIRKAIHYLEMILESEYGETV